MIPTFSAEQVVKYETIIDSQIRKGYQQISIPTGFPTDEMLSLGRYLTFYYQSGTLCRSGNFRNYRVAKNGKKLQKTENPSAFVQF